MWKYTHTELIQVSIDIVLTLYLVPTNTRFPWEFCVRKVTIDNLIGDKNVEVFIW